MLIAEILDLTKQEGEKLQTIGKRLKISHNRLREILKDLNCKPIGTGKKGWHYVGDDPSILEKSIFDFIASKKPVTPNKGETDALSAKGASRTAHSPTINAETYSGCFTLDEISILKEMISNWKTETPDVGINHNLTERMERLEADEKEPKTKIRKTIVIDEGIAKQLDDFAFKTRFNKSDIVHLALQDFILKYND